MHTIQRSITHFLIACVLIAALLPVVSEVRPAQAGGVVTDCSSDSQFSSLLAGGGTITFNCGTAQINLSSMKDIVANTTIDGGGKITLSGHDEIQLFVVHSGASLTLRNIVLTRAYFDGDGGAIGNLPGGTLTLENSTIRDSTATFSGGAILSYGPLTIINSLLEGNQALNGGALYPRWGGAQTTIVNSVLRDNHATHTTDGWGGAILAWDGAPVTIKGSSIYSNTARFGGGIYNFTNSVLTLNNVTLSGNSAQITGGGVYNDGNATLTNITLTGNTATYGGGIYNNSYLELTNVTLSGNSTQDSGGGLFNDGNATLTNVTLSGNTATYGGGIYHRSGSVNVKNTIVANSPSGGNCFNAVTNNGFNFSSDPTCSFGAGRDNVNVMLGPLADNGGPTKTHMPQSGSPVIDNVIAGCPPPSTDQRGAMRPFNGAGSGSALCDAGAVEYGAAVSVVYLPLALRNHVTYFEGPWEVEPNHDYQHANGPLRSGRDYRGYPNDENDYFSIYLAAAGTSSVTVTNFQATGDLVLRDSSLTIKARWGGSGGSTMNVIAMGLSSGWYYIQVHVDRTKPYDPTSPYTLTATFP